MRSLKLCIASGLLLAITGMAGAGGIYDLDRHSSDVIVTPGVWSVDWTDAVSPSMAINAEFQVSLANEDAGPPTNDVWDFNHYTVADGHDWTKGNFADYEYYKVQIDGRDGTLPIYYYDNNGDVTIVGNAEWTITYVAGGTPYQTVLAGTVEDFLVQDLGGGKSQVSGFLRVDPQQGYRSFGPPPVNAVEVFAGSIVLSDLVGYSFSQTGTGVPASETTWTPDDDIVLKAQVVPEPLTVLGVILGVSGIAGYAKRRFR